MQFTDIVFPFFLTVVFCLYWLVLRRSVLWQNLLLLAASYTFYGWWDWRFLGLIMLTTATTYAAALFARGRWGKLITAANIVANLAILVAFKYFNFFSENISRLFGLFGFSLDWFTLDVLLPVGISFYTFQAISYSVDVYKGRVEPCRDLPAFCTFIAYFPQLVAGPIERASQLLPQIVGERRWRTDYAVSGMRMILFGLLKKLCVADMLAVYVDRMYDSGFHGGALVVLAAGVAFAIEIYCDFSAYSEIARGVSRLFGIELMANFRFPYFSRNVIELWRRWHISLMWWFRDYVYIPLGGSRRGQLRAALNTVAVFVLSGLWHGAAWNFVLWGVYWSVVYAIARYAFKMRSPDSPLEASGIPGMIATFGVVAFGLFIFRSPDWNCIAVGLRSAWIYVAAFGAAWAVMLSLVRLRFLRVAAGIVVLCAAAVAAWIVLPQWWLLLKGWWLVPAAIVLAVEWRSRNTDFALERMPRRRCARVAFYWLCLAFILLSEPVGMTFIYFQF